MVNRIRVILFGCLLWATMTWLFGISKWVPNPFVMGAIVWAINGFGLSLVIPNSQSVIADFYSEDARGKAFGLFAFMGQIGGVLGSLYAVNMAGINTSSLRGWQIVMFSLAIMSTGIGLLNILFAKDPKDEKIQSLITGSNEEERQFLRELHSDDVERPNAKERSWGEIFKVVTSMIQIPTFCIIILQGVVGTMPWKALSTFLILYLQLIGMSNLQASVVFSVFMTGSAFGNWLGGFVGDKLSKISPNHGRIFGTQFSVFSGIPLTYLIFKLPKDNSPDTVALYCFVFIITGLLISWAAPCCNNPIFAEIVHPNDRNIIYAFDRCFEDGVASPVTYLVGLAAEEIWGFSGNASPSGDPVEDLARAKALGQALLWFSALPWTCCLVFYTGLHFTYRRDKKPRFDSNE